MAKHRLFEPQDNAIGVENFENAMLGIPGMLTYVGEHRYNPDVEKLREFYNSHPIFSECTADNCRANCCK